MIGLRAQRGEIRRDVRLPIRSIPAAPHQAFDQRARRECSFGRPADERCVAADGSLGRGQMRVARLAPVRQRHVRDKSTAVPRHRRPTHIGRRHAVAGGSDACEQVVVPVKAVVVGSALGRLGSDGDGVSPARSAGFDRQLRGGREKGHKGYYMFNLPIILYRKDIDNAAPMLAK